MIRGF